MIKNFSLLLAITIIGGLMVISTGAYFTNTIISGSKTFTGDSQCCSLKINPNDTINFAQACKMVPKSSQTYCITIKNEGTLAARWRLGMQNTKGSTQNEQFLNSLVATFYLDKEGTIFLCSAHIKDFLLDYNANAWLYDTSVYVHYPDLVPLLAGNERQLYMRIDYEGTAPKEAQNGRFDCDFVLESRQEAAAIDWPPITTH